MDNPVTVHDINELTVVTDESYTDFVTGLQKEIAESLAARPRKASVEVLHRQDDQAPKPARRVVEEALAQALYKYLVKNDYINDDDTVSEAYKDGDARRARWPSRPPRCSSRSSTIVWPLVDSLYLDVPAPDRRPQAEEDPAQRGELREEGVPGALGPDQPQGRLPGRVRLGRADRASASTRSTSTSTSPPMQYVVEAGQQRDGARRRRPRSRHRLRRVERTSTHTETVSAGSQVKYDLLGEITEKTQLTRRTAAAILSGVNPGTFAKFRQNPEQFITEAARLINEQKATVIVEHLTYDPLDDRFDTAIFTENQTKQDFVEGRREAQEAHLRLRRHRLQGRARRSSTELDTSNEVVVYAKLPRGFFIPTPVGDYNPDWAIAFTRGHASSTSTSSPRPRARCRRSSSRASRTPRSSAPGSSSPRSTRRTARTSSTTSSPTTPSSCSWCLAYEPARPERHNPTRTSVD